MKGRTRSSSSTEELKTFFGKHSCGGSSLSVLMGDKPTKELYSDVVFRCDHDILSQDPRSL